MSLFVFLTKCNSNDFYVCFKHAESLNILLGMSFRKHYKLIQGSFKEQKHKSFFVCVYLLVYPALRVCKTPNIAQVGRWDAAVSTVLLVGLSTTCGSGGGHEPNQPDLDSTPTPLLFLLFLLLVCLSDWDAIAGAEKMKITTKPKPSATFLSLSILLSACLEGLGESE